MATAASEFLAWLDTVSTDTSSWHKPKEEDPSNSVYYSNEDKKYRKTQKYIHKYMMDNHDWYRRSIEHHKELMELEEDELGLEPEPLQHNQEGFWEQFK